MAQLQERMGRFGGEGEEREEWLREECDFAALLFYKRAYRVFVYFVFYVHVYCIV
jgi:hypothetical protein